MNYIKEAVLTESDQFHGELVGFDNFIVAMTHAVGMLEHLDKIKKALYYGRESVRVAPGVDELSLEHLNLSDTEFKRVLHGVIGKATEAGELLEMILTSIQDGTPFDIANLFEEVGDGQWYDAIICDAAGRTFEQVQATNIAKLRERFPDRFTAYDANNRDLVAERKILETGPISNEATFYISDSAKD